jgi:hypothetical protein
LQIPFGLHWSEVTASCFRAYAAPIRPLAGLPGQAGLRKPFRRAEATAGPPRTRLLGLIATASEP